MRNARRWRKVLGVLAINLAVIGLYFLVPQKTSSNSEAAASSFADRDAAQLSFANQKTARAATPKAQPQAKSSSKFLHSSHTGTLTVPAGRGTKAHTVELKCGNCHEVTKEKPEPTSFPVEDPTGPHKNDAGKSHSACFECHSRAGSQSLAMCTICHVSAGSAKTKPFPNPDQEQSQFGDEFSHKSHVSIFKSAELFNPLDKDNRGPVYRNIGLFTFRAVSLVQTQTPTQPKPKPVIKFDCAKCHIADSDGVTMSAPSHQACFVCHFDESKVDAKSDTYALNCTGCHSNGKTLAVHTFKRQEVIPESKNPPFSHKTHWNELKDLQGPYLCLKCHVTGLTATTRSELLVNDKTKLPEPPFSSCSDCHSSDGKKPRPTVKPENVKCLKCHTLAKVQPLGFAPPPSHSEDSSTPTPDTSKPTTTPTTTPATTPAKPPTSTPTTNPTTTPTKPPATTPQPSNQPPKKPGDTLLVPNQPSNVTPPASNTGGARVMPAGSMLLGQPPLFGANKKPAVPFNHDTHSKVSHADRCEACHHTNKNLEGDPSEKVAKCTTCHKTEDDDTSAKAASGDVLDFQTAFHGDKSVRGCIGCHKQKPSSKAPTSCADCHTGKTAMLGLPALNSRQDIINAIAFELRPFKVCDCAVSETKVAAARETSLWDNIFNLIYLAGAIF